MIRASFTIVLAALALPLRLSAISPRTAVVQAPPAAPSQASGIISGRVYDAVTEEPLSDAAIRVVGQEIGLQTDDAGRFTLRGVRPGIVTLEIRRIGYTPLFKSDVAVSAGKPVVVAIALTLTASA